MLYRWYNIQVKDVMPLRLHREERATPKTHRDERGTPGTHREERGTPKHDCGNACPVFFSLPLLLDSLTNASSYIVSTKIMSSLHMYTQRRQHSECILYNETYYSPIHLRGNFADVIMNAIKIVPENLVIIR